MNNAKYLRAALSTFSNAPARNGLRWTSRNLGRTHIMHAGFGIHSEMTEVVIHLGDWLQGNKQMGDLMPKLIDELGDVAYFLRILAKYSRTSLPAATRRPDLKFMTPAAAIFQLLHLSERIASLQKKTFYGPKMNDKGKIDVQLTVLQDQERMAKLSALVDDFADLFWPTVTRLTGLSVGELYNKNIAKLATRYPAGFFDAYAEEMKDETVELAAQA